MDSPMGGAMGERAVRTDLFGRAREKALILLPRVVVLPEKGRDSSGAPRALGWMDGSHTGLAQLVDGETNKSVLAGFADISKPKSQHWRQLVRKCTGFKNE